MTMIEPKSVHGVLIMRGDCVRVCVCVCVRVCVCVCGLVLLLMI